MDAPLQSFMPDSWNVTVEFRRLYERTGLSMLALARAMDFRTASGIQRYMDADHYKKKYFSRELVERIERAIVGMGEPPITRDEVLALAGIFPLPGETPSNVPTGTLLEFRKVEMSPPTFGNRDVPIRSAAAGLGRGDFRMMDDVIDYAPRPDALRHARDIYAIYVTGDSMSPKDEPGDIVFVSPNRPPAAGDYVIVLLDGDNGDLDGLFKRFVRMDDDYLYLRQLNPDDTIKVARRNVSKLHRVYTNNELIGI